MGALSNRVAIVTGASRGLGKDLAVGLGCAGATVVAVARTEKEGQSAIPGTLEQTVQLVQEAGGQAVALRCDVAKEEEIQAVVDYTLKSFGRIDILVNNAGIQVPGTIKDMQVRHWDLIFTVNVKGPFLFSRSVIPAMANQGWGHILNVSSRQAVGPGPGPYEKPVGGNTHYGTTKAALERFTQGLAAELAGQGIAVNALAPRRPIWTEGGHWAVTRGGRQFVYSGWRMTSDIFRDAAVLICSQDPRAYTGNVVYDDQVHLSLGRLSEAEVLAHYPVEP